MFVLHCPVLSKHIIKLLNDLGPMNKRERKKALDKDPLSLGTKQALGTKPLLFGLAVCTHFSSTSSTYVFFYTSQSLL